MKTQILRPALFTIALYFCHFGASASAATKVLDRVLAVVGDSPILQSDLDELKQSLRNTPALASSYKLNPKNFDPVVALGRMVDERIVKQVVKELDIQVADSEVEGQINSIAKQNNISRKQLEDSLKNEGVALDIYRRNIKDQLEKRNLFDRELRRGGGISEVELKSLYEKTARPEFQLSLLAVKKSEADGAKLATLLKDIASSKITLEDGVKAYGAEPLGWIDPETLDPKLSAALKNAGPNKAYGPIEFAGRVHILLVHAKRMGSDEGFQKAKQELMAAAQAKDFDERFSAWLESKKREINIVFNK